MLNPPVNGKIQGLFKVFECFSSTFQGKLNFQGLQDSPVYFKSVRTMLFCYLKGTDVVCGGKKYPFSLKFKNLTNQQIYN